MLSFHRRDEGLEGMHHAQHIGFQDAAKSEIVRGFLGQRADRDAGIGNHDIGRADMRHEVIRGGGKGRCIGHIQRVKVMRARQAGNERFQRIKASCRECQRGALCRVVAGEGGTDAGGRPRDEDRLSPQAAVCERKLRCQIRCGGPAVHPYFFWRSSSRTLAIR